MKVNNVSFTGYRNVLCVNDKFGDSNSVVMSMQLDNNGVKDLDKWVAIQKQMFPDDEPQDTLTITNIQLKDVSLMAVNHKLLALDKNHHLITQDEESSMLKFYSLLKSINSRILNGGKPQTDPAGTKHVVNNMVDCFKRIDVNPGVAALIVGRSVQGNFFENQQECAATVNECIEELVDGYFNSIV